MVAQGAHASMKCLLDIAHKAQSISVKSHVYKNRPYKLDGDYLCIPYNNEVKDWLENRFAKIVVGVDSKDELLTIYNEAVEARLICSLILDSGFTEFGGVSTYTAVAIGPADNELIDKITGGLKLL